MRAISINGKECYPPELSTAIQKTVDFIIQLQFPSGNIPSSHPAKSDKLVAFCHGAPGAVPMFLAAYR
jgi:hypothetical protein